MQKELVALQRALRAERQTNLQLRGELERLRAGEQLGLGLAD
ncbi:hypothetical protein [Cyanobium gracile]|nr:hypothetical protein [Cyanobium gracile]